MRHPPSDGVVADDFDLLSAEGFILLRKISRLERVVSQSAEEAKDSFPGNALFRQGFEQLEMEIDPVALHDPLNSGPGAFRLRSASANGTRPCHPSGAGR